MQDYKQVLNAIALDRLTPAVYFPDFKLGIGDSENKSSLAVEIQKTANAPIQSATVPALSAAPFELASIGGGQKVSLSDFPSEFFLGNPVEGV